MAFYEDRHDFDANYLFWGDGVDFTYPLHVHRCPEIFCVTEGTVIATVEEEEYTLNAGDVAVIWSHQVHSYRTVGNSRHELCIFAPEMVPDFFVAHSGEYPESPFISAAEGGEHIPFLVRLLKKEHNLYTTKGILYILCGEMEKHVTFSKRLRGKQESVAALVSQILEWVNDHYQSDCSLDTIAEALRYEKTYLSKFFSRHIGITLSEYVLQLRLTRAGEMLLHTEDNVAEIGVACGFQSLRTFNRNFVDRYGVTPSQYRVDNGGELRKKLGRWDKATRE